MEIKPLTPNQNSVEYINNFDRKLITTKMLTRKFNIKPKEAHRILKFNKNTILCDPILYGSNKYSNKNLYQMVDQETKLKICYQEIENLKKNKTNIKSFMKSNFANYMNKKYHLVLDSEIQELEF